MKTIYISGKTRSRYIDARNKAYKAGNCGHCSEIVNPHCIDPIPNGTWQDYIERDLIYLKHCDAIYMLKDWKDSPGARIEHEFAKKLGLEIIYEEEKEEESNGNG